ncbi:MAG: DEAD/DEAH box helicase [Thermodesulfobacteriota bacterium]|nr:DEAD/DEAH box helicase [Thermodesulfobacteriota bacterium]
MTLPNPDFVQAEKYGRYTGNLDPELRFYEDYGGDAITFLRGYARQVAGMLKQAGADFTIEDYRRTLDPLPFEFKGTLRPYQQQAIDAALERDHGTLEMPTGAGKTVAAIATIQARQQPTLILCHTRELAEQWQARLEQFLNVKAGMIGGGKYEPEPVAVGLFQTVRNHLEGLPRHYGHVIVDECHRCPAESFRRCVTAFDARYLLGLSATSYRRDGLTRLIYLLMGNRVFKIDRATLEADGAILRPEVVTRATGFTYQYEDDYPAMIEALIQDQARNRQIVEDVRQNMNGGAALIVSDRISHLEILTDMLNADRQAILTGQTAKAERQRIVKDLNQGEIRFLFATLSLIGEGFDCEGLTTLFIASPIRFKGRLIQTVGRILRPAPAKRAVIYDYQDPRQPVLAAQAKARARALAEVAGEDMGGK